MFHEDDKNDYYKSKYNLLIKQLETLKGIKKHNDFPPYIVELLLVGLNTLKSIHARATFLEEQSEKRNALLSSIGIEPECLFPDGEITTITQFKKEILDVLKNLEQNLYPYHNKYIGIDDLIGVINIYIKEFESENDADYNDQGTASFCCADSFFQSERPAQYIDNNLLRELNNILSNYSAILAFLNDPSLLCLLSHSPQQKFLPGVDVFMDPSSCGTIMQKTPVEIEMPILSQNFFFISDLHGDFETLMNALKFALSVNPNAIIIFGGDSIDRGDKNLQTILAMFILKKKYPNQFFIMAGNHEQFLVTAGKHSEFPSGQLSIPSLQDDIEKRFRKQKGKEVMSAFRQAFENLPLIIYIQGYIVVHGGIWFFDGQKVVGQQETDNMAGRLDMQTLVWGDPVDSRTELLEGLCTRNSAGRLFGPNALGELKKLLSEPFNLPMYGLLRGHSHVNTKDVYTLPTNEQLFVYSVSTSKFHFDHRKSSCEKIELKYAPQIAYFDPDTKTVTRYSLLDNKIINDEEQNESISSANSPNRLEEKRYSSSCCVQ